MRILRALATLFLVLCLSQVLASQDFTSGYRDPKGRFALAAPPGWKVQPLGDGVRVVRGDSFATVMIFERSADARALLENLAAHIGKTWQKFEMVKKSDSRLSGFPAEVLAFQGVNPQGVNSMLRLEGTIAGDNGYVLVIGYPAKESVKTQETFNQIEKSFTLLKNATEPAKSSSEPAIGIEGTDLTAEDAALYHMDQPTGVLVIQLEDSGPAAQAGLRLHDVVLAIDGNSVDSAAGLERVIATHKPGDTIEVQICRITGEDKVEHRTLNITVGVRSK